MRYQIMELSDSHDSRESPVFGKYDDNSMGLSFEELGFLRDKIREIAADWDLDVASLCVAIID